MNKSEYFSKGIKFGEIEYGIPFKFNLDDKQNYIKVILITEDPKQPKIVYYVNLNTGLMYSIPKYKERSDFEYIQNRTVFITE